jgi:hypothetical protein
VLKYKASLSLTGLCVPLFALFLNVLFALSLQLTALIKLSLSLGISLTLPTIAVALGIVVTLVAQFNIALGLSLPSFVLNFAVAINFELVLVLGFLATLNALIDAIANASIIAYGWFGSAANLGASLTSALGSAWPDGTAGDQEIKAVLFVATVSGGYSKDQIAELGLMPKPNPPPTPQHPPPPDGSYPPPQAYENGLAGLTISPPTAPGGEQATGHVTVDNSVATGIGAVTAITIDNHGSGYTAPPIVQVTDTVGIVSIAAGSPVVLTLPNALTIPIGSGFGCTIADVTPDALNGPACAKVLTATTVALYRDSAFAEPISGGGTGGTVTGGGAGAAALVTMGGGATNALQSLLDGLSWPTSTGLAGGVITFRAMFATIFSLMIDLQGNLQARANLLGSIKIGVDFIPPSISASLEFLAKISANLQANLNVSLPDLTVAMSAALSAQIDAIGKLVARIGFFLGLATANVTLEIWEYTGPGNGFGATVSAGPGATGWHDNTTGSSPVTAAVFGLTNPASAAAFNTFFAGAA